MSLSWFFCTSKCGWQGVYYLFGSATIFGTLGFCFTFSDPNGAEADTKEASTDYIPYKQLFTCKPVWGLWLAAFGDALGHHMFLMYGPTLMNKVLNFSIANTGILTALPFLLTIFAKFFVGLLLDKTVFIGVNLKFKTFITIFQSLMISSFVFVTLFSQSSPVLSQLAFTCVVLFSGLFNVGLFTGAQIVAKQFVLVLTVVFSVEIGLVTLILPNLVAVIVPNNAPSEVNQTEFFKCLFLVERAILPYHRNDDNLQHGISLAH
ncbi:hypothetical protein L596_029114 [Steinernema carpocapsae]|uniref:Major facilitator superfamily (MFS) profile domain-containing protein n=1 Tax=Steinernema carpocapsae TaxID=34508 RepID=A0A4U5LTP4_STECR|nr:hypothetical protein L596_029114 [Steinernema carpocapsae]